MKFLAARPTKDDFLRADSVAWLAKHIISVDDAVAFYICMSWSGHLLKHKRKM